MWTSLNNTFLSIVAHKELPEMLLIHGRREGDIEAVFPKAKVAVTPNANQSCRAVIPRDAVVQALAPQATEIRYANVKASARDGVLHDA